MAATSARKFDESADTYFFYNDISEIAWLLNLRGEDIEFNPVFLSYLLVGERETHLFAHLEALDEIVRKELESHNITLHPYESAADLLRSLDPKKTIIGYAESMNQQAVEIFHQFGFVLRLYLPRHARPRLARHQRRTRNCRFPPRHAVGRCSHGAFSQSTR